MENLTSSIVPNSTRGKPFVSSPKEEAFQNTKRTLRRNTQKFQGKSIIKQ